MMTDLAYADIYLNIYWSKKSILAHRNYDIVDNMTCFRRCNDSTPNVMTNMVTQFLLIKGNHCDF